MSENNRVRSPHLSKGSTAEKPAHEAGRHRQPIDKTSDEVRLPNSQKIYVELNGSTANQSSQKLRIPFREIALSPSKDFNGTLEENPPVRVYDTSGPWTD